MSWNLKKELAKHLLHDVIAAGRGKDAGVVLVVDPHTSKLLSSCLRMHDLLTAGVLVLQNLCLDRERVELPAIYFVEPTEEVFERIIQDFPKPPPPPPPQPTQGFFREALAALHLTDKPPPVTPQVAVKKPHYSSAHLFFTCAVSPARMKQLQSSSIDMKRIRGFVELNIDFLAFESRVFLLDEPHWIPDLYMGEAAEDGPKNATLMPLVKQVASFLRTVLAKGEMPYIRFISEELNIGKTFISHQFANLLDREMTKQLKAAAEGGTVAASSASVSSVPSSSSSVALSSSSSSSSSVPSPPCPPPRLTTVLIVDRSLDPLTPLMHEFTFQAMVNDLLKVTGEIVHLANGTEEKAKEEKEKEKEKVEGEKVEGKDKHNNKASSQSQFPEKKSTSSSSDSVASGELVLSEDDPLWLDYRHKHIGEVMVNVNKKLKEFAANNLMAKWQHQQHSQDNKGKDSVKDALKAVSEMPEYKMQMKRYAKHVHLSEECLLKFQQKQLQSIGELEQCMATNVSVNGRIYTSNKELKDRLKSIVADHTHAKPISLLDKLRLIVIYAITQGGIPEPLFKVLSQSIHPKLLRCLVGNNLADLGVEIDAFELQLSRARIDELIQRNAEQQLALMRYVPSLKSILEGLIENSLSAQQFPYTKSGTRPSAEEEEEMERRAGKHTSKRLTAHTSSTGKPLSKKESDKLAAKELDKKLALEKDPEVRARLRMLAEADRDEAHHATGRSARRRHSDKDKEIKRAMEQSAAETAAAAAAAASSSSSSATGDSSSSSSSSSSLPPPHRYLVFMLGGLCFSEMRACYEVVEASQSAAEKAHVNGDPPAVGKQLLIGSTSALTPAEFLLDLSGLSRKEFYRRLAENSAGRGGQKPASQPESSKKTLSRQSSGASSTTNAMQGKQGMAQKKPAATSTRDAMSSSESSESETDTDSD